MNPILLTLCWQHQPTPRAETPEESFKKVPRPPRKGNGSSGSFLHYAAADLGYLKLECSCYVCIIYLPTTPGNGSWFVLLEFAPFFSALWFGLILCSMVSSKRAGRDHLVYFRRELSPNGGWWYLSSAIMTCCGSVNLKRSWLEYRFRP